MIVNLESNVNGDTINRLSPERTSLPEVDLNILTNPESILDRAPNRKETQAESQSASSGLPQPQPIVKDSNGVVAADDGVSDSQNPSIAADQDVIEKEWVERTKTILSATKEDPYQREEQIKNLQADYIFKRRQSQAESGQK